MSGGGTGSDKRDHSFFIIDNAVVDGYDLSCYEGWLYCVIARHINHQTGIAFPSIKTLAKETKMSPPTVIKYLKSLVDKGLLRYHSGQSDRRANVYELVTTRSTVKQVNSVEAEQAHTVKRVNSDYKPVLQSTVKQVNTNKTKVNKTKEPDEKKELVTPPDMPTSHSDIEPPAPPPIEAEQPKVESASPASSEDPEDKPKRAPQKHIAIIEAYWAGLPGGKPYDEDLGKHLKLAANAAKNPDFDLDGFKQFMAVVYDKKVDVWDYQKYHHTIIPFRDALRLFQVWWASHKPKVVVIPTYDRRAVAAHNMAYAAEQAHKWIGEAES